MPSRLEMLKYNLFLFLTFFCAKVTSIEILDDAFDVSEVFGGPTEDVAENLVKNMLLPDSNSKGTQEGFKSKDCTGGGLLDFIQCMAASKIKSFRQKLSKIAFPEAPPDIFQRQTMNSKVHGSLEEWLKEFTKDAIADKNCTSDE